MTSTINIIQSPAEVNSYYNSTKNVSMSINDSSMFSDANQNILSSAKKEEPTPELKGVKQEIVKILSQKENVNKENEVLKIHQLAFSQLNEENRRLKERIQTLEAKHDSDQNVVFISEILTENSTKNINDIDRSSPDGQEIDNTYPSLSTERSGLTNEEVVKLKEKIKLLETEKSNSVKESMLLEKNE